MSPREPTVGAVPLAKLAELDSDMHHLRDQNDRDRRETAARAIEYRDSLENLRKQQAATDAQLGRVADLVNRLDVTTMAHTKILETISNELAERRGGDRTWRWLISLVAVGTPILFEILRHIWK